MREDPRDHGVFVDGGDDLQLAAIRAMLNVDVEHAYEQPRPGHALRFAVRVLLRGFARRPHRIRHDRSAQLRMRGEHPVKADQVQARAGCQAARRCMNSWGCMTMWVVPSRYGLFSFSTTWPLALRLRVRDVFEFHHE